MDDLSRAGIESIPVRGTPPRALDFGSGVGRLSIALSEFVPEVNGVDISGTMVDKAREMAGKRLGADQDRVRFFLNQKPDLSLFDDGEFGMVLSLICLQHMEPKFSRGYIDEFCRVTAPDGIVVFQLPTRRNSAMLRLRGAVGRSTRRVTGKLRGEAVMEMYGTPRAEVESRLENSGMEMLGIFPNDLAATWESLTYVARQTTT